MAIDPSLERMPLLQDQHNNPEESLFAADYQLGDQSTLNVSTVDDIDLPPTFDPETGEAIYSCPQCDKTYRGKHGRSIWRRHLQDKHSIPLAVQPRRTRWDNVIDRPRDDDERRQRTLESKRRWARKNRADKKAKRGKTAPEEDQEGSVNVVHTIAPTKRQSTTRKTKAERNRNIHPDFCDENSYLPSPSAADGNDHSPEILTGHDAIDPALAQSPNTNTLNIPRLPFNRAHSAPIPVHRVEEPQYFGAPMPAYTFATEYENPGNVPVFTYDVGSAIYQPSLPQGLDAAMEGLPSRPMQRSLSASFVERSSPAKASHPDLLSRSVNQAAPPLEIADSGAAMQLLALKGTSSLPNSPKSGSPHEAHYLDDLALEMAASDGTKRRRSPRKHRISLDLSAQTPQALKRARRNKVESSPPCAGDASTFNFRSMAQSYSPQRSPKEYSLTTSPPELFYDSSLSSIPSMETQEEGDGQRKPPHGIFNLSSPGHPDASMNLGLIPTHNGIGMVQSMLSSPWKGGQMIFSLR